MPRPPWWPVRAADPSPDADLLARFAADGDPAAFEVLVWRHGRMVFATCRRTLGDHHSAEDAFQATFLILARKAGSVRGSVPAYLHRVARRAAGRAAWRVPRPARLATDPPAPPAAPADFALRAVLDEEIDRLPDRLRRPVVLCYLEGRTTDQAAGLLGVPRGTVLSRLSAAREKLAARLARRGVTGPAVLLAAAGGAEPLAAGAVGRCVGAAVGFAGSGAAGGPAAILAEGVMRTAKLKAAVLAGGLMAATLGVGVVVAQRPDPTPAPAAKPPADPKPDHVRAMNLAQKKDMEAVQGMWVVANGWVMSGPQTVELEELVGKLHLLVADDRAELFAPPDQGRLQKSTGLDYPIGIHAPFRFTLDPSADPKQIDLKGDDSETAYGLYSLDRDRLTVCAQMGEDGRPRNFDQAKGDAWGRVSLTFRRTTDSDDLKAQRRLAKTRSDLVEGVQKLVRENEKIVKAAGETGAEFLQRNINTLDEIDRIVKAMRAKTDRELKAYPPTGRTTEAGSKP
jgi:RNA polymerase sigma factor (sigma-70 family)